MRGPPGAPRRRGEKSEKKTRRVEMRNLQLNPLTRLSALQVGDRWGGVPANVFTLHISKLGGGGDFGESVTPVGVFLWRF